MATEFESTRFRSPRRRRRYRIDESGVTEFDAERNFLRFIPWYDSTGIRGSHDCRTFTVRSRRGASINGLLEPERLSEFNREARSRWRAALPHAYRDTIRRDLRVIRRVVVLYPPLINLALVSALLAVLQLTVSLGFEPDPKLVSGLPGEISLAIILMVLNLAFYFLMVGPIYYLSEFEEDAPSFADGKAAPRRGLWVRFIAWRSVIARSWKEELRGLTTPSHSL
jgi:hypothetical protein